MALINSVYQGMLFNFLIAAETTLGSEETVDANFVSFALDSPVDMDWSTSIMVDDTQRTGQLVGKGTDYFATKAGATTSVGFSWIVAHEEGLQMLMQLISEDSATPYTLAGTFVPPVYAHGVDTGEKATVIIVNPDSARDRTMTGAILTELTLAADAGTAGGRLTASGTFMSGYDVVIGPSTVVASGTETEFLPVLPDLTVMTIGGNDTILESMSVTFTYPAAMIGTQGDSYEPQLVARANPKYEFSGEVTVKKDANSAAALTAMQAGSEIPLIFTGTDWGITVTQAVITGYTPDLTNEKGALVTIAFSGRATAAELLFSIATP